MVNWIYEVPWFEGGVVGSPVMRQIFSGWQLSGVYTYRSGSFLRFGGMIAPDMATMLGFVTTDARVEPALLPHGCAHAAVIQAGDGHLEPLLAQHDGAASIPTKNTTVPSLTLPSPSLLEPPSAPW